jgi:hypothetical protein
MVQRLNEAATRTAQRHRPCPRCGSVGIHRSRHRTRLERLLSFTGIWIRRCHGCGLRFVRFAGLTVSMGSAGATAGRRLTP